MTRSLFIILLLLVTKTGLSQLQEKPPPELTEEVVKKNNYESACILRNNYSAEQRSQFYPFNKGTEVKIVSFSTTKKDLKDTGELPLKGKEVDYTKLKEIKQLSKSQIDELTNILFNYNYRGEPIFGTDMLCYNPKNAILFIDNKGKTFEFIEICFECENSVTSNDKIQLGDKCIGKYKMLQNFFANNGISYGSITIKTHK